jgi:hypothetical protein
MSQNGVNIVLDGLTADKAEDPALRSLLIETRDLAAECQEIAELRRLVLEVSEPDPVSYTTT